MVFSIVIFIAVCYMLTYFILGLVMNILLFASDDFKAFTSGDYAGYCTHEFIVVYIIMEIMPPLCFLISYAIIEIVTRTHIPTILTYTYN
jgi:hypothetical protein